MPSTYSVSKFVPRLSSTVMTPSRPTRSITSAISSPICGSAAETVAICAISLRPSTGAASLLMYSTMAATPFSMPWRSCIGFAPAARFFRPSVTMGEPNFLSIATLRPLGPRVVLTAAAMVSMPFLRERRAASSKRSCLAMCAYSPVHRMRVIGKLPQRRPGRRNLRLLRGLDHCEDIGLAQHEQFVAIQLELCTTVLGEEDTVTDLDLHLGALAIIQQLADAYRDDFTLLGLFFRGVGDDQTRLGHLFLLQGLDDHTVSDGMKFCSHSLFLLMRYACGGSDLPGFCHANVTLYFLPAPFLGAHRTVTQRDTRNGGPQRSIAYQSLDVCRQDVRGV